MNFGPSTYGLGLLAGALSTLSLWVTPTNASRPWPCGRMAPTTWPSTDTEADETRCTRTRMSLDAARCGYARQMSVLVAFSVTPLGVGEGVGEIVAEAVRVVRESGLPSKTDSMFTVIEGETWEEVMAVVQRAVEAVAARAPRVSTVIKADWRAGASDAMNQKVASIERYLSKPAIDP